MAIPIVILVSESKATLGTTLHKNFRLYRARSGKQALQLAQEHLPTTGQGIFIVNADSLGTTGERICRNLRDAHPHAYIVHIYPPQTTKTDATCADVVLNAPVTPRKLTNTIKRFADAGQTNSIIRCANFILDTQTRVLTAHGEEIALNPKQASLVEVFFKHPNQTLTREMLMREVWQTDYIGDTRTLSVHIRWLRNALEPDNATPRYLLTVRGIGYRLQITTDG